MNDDNKLSYFFFGLGLGLAVGFLFAPQSGEKTRELLRTKADEGKDFLRRRGEEIYDQANDLIERGRTGVVRQREQLTAAFEAGKQAYRESVANPPAEGGAGA